MPVTLKGYGYPYPFNDSIPTGERQMSNTIGVPTSLPIFLKHRLAGFVLGVYPGIKWKIQEGW